MRSRRVCAYNRLIIAHINLLFAISNLPIVFVIGTRGIKYSLDIYNTLNISIGARPWSFFLFRSALCLQELVALSYKRFEQTGSGVSRSVY